MEVFDVMLQKFEDMLHGYIQEEFASIHQKIQLLPREINALIKLTKDKLTV